MKTIKFVHNPGKVSRLYHAPDALRLYRMRKVQEPELSQLDECYVYYGSLPMDELLAIVSRFVLFCQLQPRRGRRGHSAPFVRGWKVQWSDPEGKDKIMPVQTLLPPPGPLSLSPWKCPTKKMATYTTFTAMKVRAFDYEAFSDTQEAFMLAVNDFDDPTRSIAVYEQRRDIHDRPIGSISREFLLGVQGELAASLTTLFLYFSYNGAGYDNQFLLDEFYGNRHMYPKLVITLGQGGGGKKTVLFELRCRASGSVAMFRDAIQYFPATDRASLDVLSGKVKSPWRKDTSIKLSHINAAYKTKAFLRGVDENYLKVRQYCTRDVAAVFGVAMYVGQLFYSFPKVREKMIDTNLNFTAEQRAKFGIFFYGFTLSNLTYLVAQFIDEKNDVQSIFPRDFLSLQDPLMVMMMRRSIYGGRTLSPAIGKILTSNYFHEYKIQINAVDVSSMYPQASMAPLPGGAPVLINDSSALPQLSKATFNPYDHLPFICAVRFRKKAFPHHVVTEWGEVVCPPLDLMPSLPYRENSLEYIGAEYLSKKMASELRWINHTNNLWYDGFYNSIHIFTMLELGFQVEYIVSAELPAIQWPYWTESLAVTLREVYACKYAMKKEWVKYQKEFEAKLIAQGGSPKDFYKGERDAVDPALMAEYHDHYEVQIDYYAGREKAYKIILNGLIGKFAQKPGTKMDSENPLASDEVQLGKVLYQLNSFIMAYKDRIGVGMMAWVATGRSRDIRGLAMATFPLKGLVLYSDTDNCIFLCREDIKIDEALKEDNLLADGFLGPFHRETVLFDFKLEPEDYHICPATKAGGWRHELFFCMARKMYLLQCEYCHQRRVKNKGHRSEKTDKETGITTGFQTDDIVKALLPITDVNKLLLGGDRGRKPCSCKDCLNERFYDLAYPNLPVHVRPNSGSFTFLKKVMPSRERVEFGIVNCEMHRVISLHPAIFQQLCHKCKLWIHK